MRPIDADALIEQEKQFTDRSKYTDLAERMIELLEAAPTIDAEPVIRCKDCEHWVPGFITDHDDFIPPRCARRNLIGPSADEHCCRGKRREE